MRVFAVTCALVFCFGIPLRGQVENREENPGSDLPDFFLEAISFQAPDTAQARIDIYIQVPYEVLRFLSSDSSFVARYEITIDVLGTGGDQVLEKVWTEEVSVHSFEQTQMRSGYSLTQRSITLGSGSYVLRAQLRELESRKVSIQIKKLEIRSYARLPFSVSDIMLVNRVAREGGHMRILPNISGNLYNIADGIHLFFELYSTLTNADSADVTYRIFDKREKELNKVSERRFLSGKRTQVIATLDSVRLPVGTYMLEVDAQTVPNSRDSIAYRIGKRRNFVMRWGSAPISILDIDLAIKQTRYIATDKEYDAMTDAKSPEEKQRLFQEFWRKRDPSPDTQRNEYMEEYYSRVQYSNEHFSHYIEGWRTDMGMVFIVLGSPNNVDRHPFDYDSKPYEVWSYYEYNREIVFVDQTGFGDYKLITPIWDLLRRGR